MKIIQFVLVMDIVINSYWLLFSYVFVPRFANVTSKLIAVLLESHCNILGNCVCFIQQLFSPLDPEGTLSKLVWIFDWTGTNGRVRIRAIVYQAISKAAFVSLLSEYTVEARLLIIQLDERRESTAPFGPSQFINGRLIVEFLSCSVEQRTWRKHFS